MRSCTKTNQQSGVATYDNPIYIEESTCPSQPMVGTNEDGLMAIYLKPSCNPLPQRQPSSPLNTPLIVFLMAWARSAIEPG